MPSSILIHCDWSVNPRKRWLAKAVLDADRWRIFPPEPAATAAPELLDPAFHTRDRGGDGEGDERLLIGFDVPFGLPLAYARQVDCPDFRSFLGRLSDPAWGSFFRPANNPAEISLTRPFYPQRPGGARRAHLLAALGVDDIDDLRRRCDRATGERPAAAPLFWTIGPQQVGKAAISVWRDVLTPALERVALWPFDGRLSDLRQSATTVVVEAYPAEFYTHLGINFRRPGLRGGKRARAARQANAAPLLAWLDETGCLAADELRSQIEGGFGDDAAGEDRFDALTGLVGMLNVVLGRRPAGEPADDDIRQIEGNLLGLAQDSGPGRPG